MDPSCKNECVLTPSEFEEVCKHAKDGKTEELNRFVSKILETRNCRVGAKTFCPEPRLLKPAPFVLAAQYGRKEVIHYFLKYFGDVFDINHSATMIVFLTIKTKVHGVTALWISCAEGHLEIAKILVAHGANVNLPTVTRSTPLKGAAFHGNVELMEFLLSHDAEIDTPNLLGQSPLCIAAMRGHLEAVKYLISKGANLHQKTTNGYSIMHLSAAKGKVEIVKHFLSIGMSPMFVEESPLNKEYIPCPLFLAASRNQENVVEELIHHPNCPPSCQVDALLLLGATKCEISGFTKDVWIRALTLREENKLQTKFLPPIDSYGNRIEMTNLEVFHQLSSKLYFNEAYFQSLIIRERCMGYAERSLIVFLIQRGRKFSLRHKREAELLWYRAMEMEIEACKVEMSRGRNGLSGLLQGNVEKHLAQYCDGIWAMIHGRYIPNFARYLEFAFRVLGILDLMQTTSEDGWTIDLQSLLGMILYIFTFWLHSTDDTGNVRCSERCEELGSRFVTKYLYAVRGSTLLHHALTCFTDLKNDDVIFVIPTINPLIKAMLRWGANKVIGVPNCEGKRPITIALEIEPTGEYKDTDAQELISLLVSGGTPCMDPDDADTSSTAKSVADLEERLKKAELQLKDARERTRNAETRATQAENEVQDARERTRNAETRSNQAENKVKHARKRTRNAETRATQAENEVVLLQQQIRERDRMVREAEERIKEADMRAATAEQRVLTLLDEKRSRDEKKFWVVQRSEIELTDQELGRGGWAVVKVANFRGLKVAAKCLHSVIISDYNRQLFVREMNIAATVRHPNLVQFMGATVKGEPIILTELMATCLRAVLERRPIDPSQITSISLDVARALNYLHLMHPDPIIHRDISSANVLLNPAPSNNWKAKVSDYGSANFVRRVATIGPGNPTYAAPEANDPKQQSPKMDVYSYGVLLLEMHTRRFPDEDDRDDLLQEIKEPAMSERLQRCLDDKPDKRPSMSELLKKLGS